MQQRELTEEVRQILHHHGDLVVKAVTDGPHEKIVDPVSICPHACSGSATNAGS